MSDDTPKKSEGKRRRRRRGGGGRGGDSGQAGGASAGGGDGHKPAREGGEGRRRRRRRRPTDSAAAGGQRGEGTGAASQHSESEGGGGEERGRRSRRSGADGGRGGRSQSRRGRRRGERRDGDGAPRGRRGRRKPADESARADAEANVQTPASEFDDAASADIKLGRRERDDEAGAPDPVSAPPPRIHYPEPPADDPDPLTWMLEAFDGDDDQEPDEPRRAVEAEDATGEEETASEADATAVAEGATGAGPAETAPASTAGDTAEAAEVAEEAAREAVEAAASGGEVKAEVAPAEAAEVASSDEAAAGRDGEAAAGDAGAEGAADDEHEGDAAETAGEAAEIAGEVKADAGEAAEIAGEVTADAGDAAETAGEVTADAGEVTADAGDAAASAGNASDVTASASDSDAEAADNAGEGKASASDEAAEVGDAAGDADQPVVARAPKARRPAPEVDLDSPVYMLAGVKFSASGRIHLYDAGDGDYARGEQVVVESERGVRVGVIAVAAVRKAHRRGRQLKQILRRPNRGDLRTIERNHARAEEALRDARAVARRLEMPIKVFRAEPAHTGKRLIIYFTAEERIDFRALVRELSRSLNCRVEMRQTGVRDEARAVGGIGSCGRELCCTTWLPEFVPVSIKMAKDQGLVLNPTKVSGQCGRLKCCLVYEQATYAELRKGLPKLGKRVITSEGDEGRVVEVDVLRQRVRVSLGPGDFRVLTADQVKPMFPSQPQRGGRKSSAPE